MSPFRNLQRVLLFLAFYSQISAAVTTPPAPSGPLDLAAAVNEGLGQSAKVQEVKAKYEEAEWKTKETYGGFLPSLNLSSGYLTNKQYEFLDLNFNGQPLSIAQVVPTGFWSLNANFPLFEGFSSYNNYRAAKLSQQAAEKQFRLAQFQVGQEIRLKFFQAISAKKLFAVSQQNVTTLDDHFQQTRALKRGGIATNYDVLRVEVQLNEAKSEVLKSQDDVEISRRRVIQAMGLDADDRELTGDLPEPNDRLAAHLKWQPDDNLDLASQAQSVQSLERREDSAGSYWVPRINLGAQWISYNNRTDGFNDYDNYRWAYNIGIYLNWNLFDGMVSVAKSQESIKSRVAAEKALHLSRQQVEVDFEYWQKRYIYNATLYKAKQSEVEQAQESVRLAKEGYRAGSRTSSEVLDAELDLFRARAGVVNAQVSSAEALVNLELALGHQLN